MDLKKTPFSYIFIKVTRHIAYLHDEKNSMNEVLIQCYIIYSVDVNQHYNKCKATVFKLLVQKEIHTKLE